MGELTGYSPPYATESNYTIIAPNEAVARAWAIDRRRLDEGKVTACTEEPFDAFIQEHVW